MADIKDTKNNLVVQFKKLKQLLSLGKTPDYEQKLSKLSQSVSKFASSSTRNIFQDVIKSLYSKNGLNGQQSLDVKELIKDFGIVSGPEADRITRYEEYDEIVRKISYAKRALHVLRDNILSPDDYMLDSLKFAADEEGIDEDEIIKIYQLINKMLHIEEHTNAIVETTLQFGDYFCEIILVDEELKKHGLLENISLVSEETITATLKVIEESDDKEIDKNIRLMVERVKPNKDISILGKKLNDKETKNESLSSVTKENKLVHDTLSNIYLQFYEPTRVVRVGERPCFGFLIFPSLDRNFSQPERLNRESAKKLLKRILGKINMKDKEFEKLCDQPDLKRLLSQLLLYQDSSDNMSGTQIRFVPADNMVHFRIDSLQNMPYGQSIFFGQEFLAKILIVIQTTLAIQRITNSGEKRIIGVEIGLPRDAKQIIDEMKQKFKRKRYSIDSLGTIKDVPSVLTSFEDIYLPMKDGKRFVEFDTTSTQRNISERVEDLQAIRDHFIAGLNVPPAFLSVEENLESKSTLTQQNLVFTRSVIVYQKMFSKYFTELFKKIYVILYGERKLESVINNVSVTFSKPKSLKIEMDAEYYDQVNRLIQTLKELGIPEDYILKRFLKDDIDQTKLEGLQISEKIDGLIKNEEEEAGGY